MREISHFLTKFDVLPFNRLFACENLVKHLSTGKENLKAGKVTPLEPLDKTECHKPFRLWEDVCGMNSYSTSKHFMV